MRPVSTTKRLRIRSGCESTALVRHRGYVSVDAHATKARGTRNATYPRQSPSLRSATRRPKTIGSSAQRPREPNLTAADQSPWRECVTSWPARVSRPWSANSPLFARASRRAMAHRLEVSWRDQPVATHLLRIEPSGEDERPHTLGRHAERLGSLPCREWRHPSAPTVRGISDHHPWSIQPVRTHPDPRCIQRRRQRGGQSRPSPRR